MVTSVAIAVRSEAGPGSPATDTALTQRPQDGFGAKALCRVLVGGQVRQEPRWTANKVASDR
jgi:hypothetical protein